eukprot:TRINITY_DN9796_c0_g1_i1.p1 TRINITY_DN9796_c0_g1~~TRINITY_DN9796_c0_g1_i1.p1  ORF type:complete len:282 (+),score=23.44 TRINITY_DN9796_c0_g1_i1:62-907(+)
MQDDGIVQQTTRRLDSSLPAACCACLFLTVWCLGWFGGTASSFISLMQAKVEQDSLASIRWQRFNCTIKARGIVSMGSNSYWDLGAAIHEDCETYRASMPAQLDSSRRLKDDSDRLNADADNIDAWAPAAPHRRLVAAAPPQYMVWFVMSRVPVNDNDGFASAPFPLQCGYPYGTSSPVVTQMTWEPAHQQYTSHPEGSLIPCFANPLDSTAPLALYPDSIPQNTSIFMMVLVAIWFLVPCCCCLPCFWGAAFAACIGNWYKLLCGSDDYSDDEQNDLLQR